VHRLIKETIMATRTTAKTAAGVQPKGNRVGMVAVTGIYSVGAALSLSAGDVIQMVKVPKGATVVYLALSGGSGDALVSVGDGVDDDRYIVAVTMSSAQPTVRTISAHTGNTPYVYSVDDTIDIAVSTVSVGTTTGGFHLTVFFSMDT
jgi:hypothetical protein